MTDEFAGGQTTTEHVLTIPEVYHAMRERWGEEWIVDRLLDLAHHTECDWLEFKATMLPPKEKWEYYTDEKKASYPKWGKGDYILHVIKAIVAFANSGCGGIVLLGIAENKAEKSICPADIEGLCFQSTNMPCNTDLASGSIYWNIDGWEQEVHMELINNSFTDRYQTTWRCSVELNSKIIFGRGVFRRQPVLILIVPPEPSPIWLIRETQVGVKNCPYKSSPTKGGCHFPHGTPQPEKVIHIMKRVGASVDEWDDPRDLLARWNSRNKICFGLDKLDQAEFSQFSQTDLSFLTGLSALRRWTFMAVSDFLGEEKITFRGNVPDYTRKKGSYCFYGEFLDELELSAGLLCRNLLYDHELQKPLPLFLKTLTPEWMQMLECSTSSFFEQQLTLLGKGWFSLGNIKFFGQRGKLKFIMVAPEFISRDLEDLWFRAVRELKDKYFNADILLFCRRSSNPMTDCVTKCIPVQELINQLNTTTTQGEENAD